MDENIANGQIEITTKNIEKIYGSSNAYFLVNGCTSGILASVFAVTQDGSHVVVSGNCSKSVQDAMEIRHLDATYIEPDTVTQYGVHGAISHIEIERALMESDEKPVSAVIITCPTEAGVVSDIRAIASICNKREIPLIVDETYGAHFSLNDRLPLSAISQGADIVIHRTDSTIPAYSQTGVLHVRDKLVDINYIEKYLRMFQTDSPSRMLQEEVVKTYLEYQDQGERMWEDFFSYRMEFLLRTGMLEHLQILSYDDFAGYPGIESLDPCRVIVSTVNSDIEADSLARRLREEYGIESYVLSSRCICIVVTYKDSMDKWDKLAQSLIEVDSFIGRPTGIKWE